MAISPYTDRVKNDLEKRVAINNSKDVLVQASSDIHRYSQGVSVKSFIDSKCTLSPFVSANGYPQGENQIINHQMEQYEFGYSLEFNSPSSYTESFPFEDISSGMDPVSFLRDPGITAYPQVLLNPNYLNPGAMDGIIEPLSVRGTLPGASIDSPFVARSVKASVEKKTSQYVINNSGFDPRYDNEIIYIDSQDTRMSVGSFALSVPGISDFEKTAVSPYEDSQRLVRIENSLSFQNESDFNDSPGLGIISKMIMNTAFDFDRDRSVSRGQTGIRNVSNMTSLAFGGLMN